MRAYYRDLRSSSQEDSPAASYLGLFNYKQFMITCIRREIEWKTPTVAVVKSHQLAWGIFHLSLPPEICLPNYVLLSPILKISWFPQSISEVKLQRELVGEDTHWNMEDETFSGICRKKNSQSYFNLQERYTFQHFPSLHVLPGIL